MENSVSDKKQSYTKTDETRHLNKKYELFFKKFGKAFIYKTVIASILEHKNHSTGFRIFRI